MISPTKSPCSGVKRPRGPSANSPSKRCAAAAAAALRAVGTQSPRSASYLSPSRASLPKGTEELATSVWRGPTQLFRASPEVAPPHPFQHLLVYYDTNFQGPALSHDLELRDLLMQVEKTIKKASLAQKNEIRAWVRSLLKGPKERLFAEVGMFFYSAKKGEGLALPGGGFKAQLHKMMRQCHALGKVRPFLRLFIDIMFLEERTLNLGGVYAVYVALCNRVGNYFEEEHRLQMLALLSAIIHSPAFRVEIESRAFGESVDGEMSVLICQELGMSEEGEFYQADTIYGILHSLLSPIRQECDEGNCYVIGALQTLLYQAPEKAFSLLFSLCQKYVHRGEEGEEINLFFLRLANDAFSPRIPYTLQRLLIGVAEFYSLNLAVSRREIFHSWIERLLATSPADHPQLDVFRHELMNDFMRNFYFVDASRNGKLAVLCPSRTQGNEDTLDLISNADELAKHIFLTCKFATDENDELEALSQTVTTFLWSEEGNAWLQEVFHQERIEWQGNFSDMYTLLGVGSVTEEQIATSPEQLLQLLCNRPFTRPYLVGISDHGFIHSPSLIERYRKDPTAEFQKRVISHGEALMQKPFDLGCRRKVNELFGLEVDEPAEEALAAYCARTLSLIPEDKKEEFSTAVNTYARCLSHDHIVDHVLSKIVPDLTGGGALKEHLKRQEWIFATPQHYARELQKLYGWDAMYLESEICRISGLPETVILGDLFWTPAMTERPEAIHLATTFDVVTREVRLCERKRAVYYFKSWGFIGNEITLFLPA